MPSLKVALATAALLLSPITNAEYSIETDDDIKATASQLAFDLLSYYSGNTSGQTIGILPGPPPDGSYYWWEAGAMWGTMMDYWYYTGDESYNDVVMEAMLAQKGVDEDYQPLNWTASLGNDDQGFWGMSAMLAAELGFPDPEDGEPGWLALAQAVWNTQAADDRHDDTCGGGLRWQIPLSNTGYNYKNSIANGCFFNLGARLARYLENDTYVEWAEETYDWMLEIGYIDDEWNIYDGGHVEYECTDINEAQFSYNAGIFAQGAAFLYNYTDGATKWQTALDGIVPRALEVFFPEDIAYEVACEGQDSCTTDMLSFKGYVHRWLTQVTQLAPYLADTILPVLATSAAAGLATCTGGDTGRACGFAWHNQTFDSTGAGQQMNVLAAVSALLVNEVESPVTNSTGGTSVGDYTAGSDSTTTTEDSVITTGDKAGAAILTILVLGSASGVFGWMSLGA